MKYNIYIQKMLTKEQLFSLQSGWSNKLLTKYKSEFTQFFINLKNHFVSNKNTNKIFKNYIKNKKLTIEESDELKLLIKDNLKFVGLGSLAILPIPGSTFLMLFLINSAKKLNIDLVPTEFKKDKITEAINHTLKHENWGESSKIILRNDESPNQKLIGVLDYQTMENEYYIESIAIQPYYRKMGYAKMLFDELVKEAKQNNITIITLDAYSMDPTRISTEKLVEMYQKWGFNVIDLPQQNKVKMIYNV